MLKTKEEFEEYRQSQLDSLSGLVKNPKDGLITIIDTNNQVRELSLEEYEKYSDKSNISSIIVGNGVTKFPDDLDAVSKKNLTTLVLNSDMEEVGENAFLGSRLSEFVTPPSMKKLGKQALAYSMVKDVTLNEGLEEMDSTFLGSHVQSIDLPATLKSYPFAFSSCLDLKKANFEEGIDRVSQGAFSNSGLTSVRFPDSMREVENAAFNGNHNLTHARFNDGLEKIGDLSFFDTSVNKVMMPLTVEDWKSSSFNKSVEIRMPGDVEHDEVLKEARDGLENGNVFLMMNKFKELFLEKAKIAKEAARVAKMQKEVNIKGQELEDKDL